jgi:protein-tyrosine phosphatase
MSILSWFKNDTEKIIFPIGEFMQVDMHSHLLPGIDDGAKDINDSIELMQGMYNAGIRKFITTPHVMADIHRNTPSTISNAYHDLKIALKEYEHLNNIHHAGEYMMDDQFEGKLHQKEVTCVFDNMLLVETPILNRPFNIETNIFQIETAGYVPILAHPERYMYLFRQHKDYYDLKNRGCLFQLNVLSLTGYYGKMEKEAAIWLLENNLVDLLGTDMHHKRHLANFKHYKIEKRIVKMLEKSTFLNNKLV